MFGFKPSSTQASIPSKTAVANDSTIDIPEIIESISLIQSGSFDSVPVGNNDIGSALKQLALTLQQNARRDLENTVRLSVSLCDETIAAANMTRAVKEIDNRVNTIASA